MNGLAEECHMAQFPQAPGEFIILQDWPRSKPAELFKDCAAAKNTGIAVEDAPSAAPAVDAAQTCRGEIFSLVDDIEIPARNIWIGQCRAHVRQRAAPETNIG